MQLTQSMNFTHPAFQPYRDLLAALDLARGLPSLDALNALATARDIHQANGCPVRFVAPQNRLAARVYETHILQTGEVPTRADTWHDVLNALVWLRFPQFKSALNAAHGEAIPHEIDATRGRRRDALTVLDESGVWAVSRDPDLPALLTERAWHTLFWDRRQAVETEMRFVVVGHALLEKMGAPYPAMTGKCLLLPSTSLDADAAEQWAVNALGDLIIPRQLAPLPVQGVPGWDADNDQAAYYANTAIFRPA